MRPLPVPDSPRSITVVSERHLRHLRLHLAERRRRADEAGKVGLLEHLVTQFARLVAEPLPLGHPPRGADGLRQRRGQQLT